MPRTREQQMAIDARSPVLLVSAAAGSGKTSVLVSRAMSLIENEGYSVRRMLIVTFTRAAAGEMRARLCAALRERADESERFREELARVDSAPISTIHVFCQKLVREFFQVADAPPDPKQLDEPTGARLMDEALSEAIDEQFEEQSDDMRALSGKYRDDQLIAMTTKLYDFVMARPDPEGWLRAQADRAFSDRDFEEGAMARELLTEASLLAGGIAGLCDKAWALAQSPLFPDKLRELAQADRETAKALVEACASVPALRKAAGEAAFSGQVRLSPKASEEEVAYKEQFALLRASYKDLFKKLRALVPSDTDAAIADMNAMRPAVRALCALCLRFMDKYAEKKRELGAIDFTDLEHMALKILSQDELREEISARYDAIFIDEYQDVSAIQESVLSSLYQGVKSVFLVGDVKQSIYRFRQADPTLFMDKEARFSLEADSKERKIVLNRNFRSRKTVLSAVNAVFERVMKKESAEIEYDDAARLYAGVDSEQDPPTELHLFGDTARRSKEQAALEARAAALRILSLVGTKLPPRAGAPEKILQFRDIAILLPKSAGIAPVVEDELTRAGVPVYCEDSGSSLSENEITQTLAALKLLDNRMDDPALLTLLRGPLYAFTEGELALVRLALPGEKQSYLSALVQKATDTDSLGAKCRSVLDSLERERFLMSAMPLDEYLWDYLKRTGLYAFYGGLPGGRFRQANLRMLCARAGNIDGDASDFLRSVTGVSAARDKSSPSVISPFEDVVRVMTMHKSKGLEFPVVFLLGLSDRLTKSGGESSLQLHPRLGLSLDYINEELSVTRKTALSALIRRVKTREEKNERARLLYVAMTRARDKLILMGHVKEGALPESWFLPDTAMRAAEATTMLDWLGQAAADLGLLAPEGFSTLSTGFPQKSPLWEVVFHRESIENPQQPADEPPFFRAPAPLELPPEAVGLTPPAPIAPPRPFKLGVTALIRKQQEQERMLSEDEETPKTKALPLTTARAVWLPETPTLPSCLMEAPAEATGAQRGTATHRALSLIPLDTLRKENTLAAVKKALDALAEKNVISQAERALVNTARVAAFYDSDYGRRMLASPTVRREWAFNLRDEALSDAVIQGVIDLSFLENGEWVLLDYKTDRVETVDELIGRYQRQITIYADALAKITGTPVKEAALYSLSLGSAVTVPV